MRRAIARKADAPMSYTKFMDYVRRQRGIEEILQRKRLEALLVTHPPNIRYLTGFTGSSGALLLFAGGRRAPVFFTDGRYREQAQDEVQRARVMVGKGSALVEAARYASRRKLPVLGVEAEHTSLAQQGVLRQNAGGLRIRATSGLVQRARMVKDEEELHLLQAAAKLGLDLLEVALGTIRPGVREIEVAAELEYAARRAGATAMSFETIVASGPRSALPHGTASEARIPAKGFVILDFGVILSGYCSDMTRTVHVGRCPRSARTVYEAVRQAQEAAVEQVRAGAGCSGVDAAARKLLQKKRLDGYFSHSTGHGVGLEIHEPPRLGHGQNELLQAGMVVTVEPGVYIPREGGVRIEDMVVVEPAGHRILTPAPRTLLEL
jgi:Xaa-Pro aminopeptidase